MSPKLLTCSLSIRHVQSRCTRCISLNVKIFLIGSKLHTYQKIATKKAHADVCYLIKESSIEIHIPGQDGDVRHISVYNTNVPNIKIRYGAISTQKWHIIDLKQFS